MLRLTAITWNYADLLRSASNGTFTSCYVYNAGGDRTRKVVVKGNIREERVYLGNYELYRKYVNNTLDTERQTLHIADDQHRFALIDRLTVKFYFALMLLDGMLCMNGCIEPFKLQKEE